MKRISAVVVEEADRAAVIVDQQTIVSGVCL
jgi:hypothetical protein